MAKVSRIKMKNGKYYLFNGLTRVRSNFSYTLLICLFNPIVFLHCTFHFRLFFLFLFHSFHSYQSHYWYFLQTCSFLAFHSPRISYFLLFFPFSYSSFPLSTFIYIFFPSSSIASFDRTFLFLSPINLFPKFLLSISPYNEQSRCLLHSPPPRSIPFTLPKFSNFGSRPEIHHPSKTCAPHIQIESTISVYWKTAQTEAAIIKSREQPVTRHLLNPLPSLNKPGLKASRVKWRAKNSLGSPLLFSPPWEGKIYFHPLYRSRNHPIFRIQVFIHKLSSPCWSPFVQWDVKYSSGREAIKFEIISAIALRVDAYIRP